MDGTWLQKAIENFGSAGLIVMVLWKLVDKWAGLFLASQKDQTAAMASLAAAVQAGTSDQREVLIAVSVIAQRVEEQKKYMISIDEKLRGPMVPAGGGR